MDDNPLEDPRQIWDERYSRSRQEGFQLNYEPWLSRWLGALDLDRHSAILDLGCGGGHDSQYLLERGFRLAACDFSAEALHQARGRAVGAHLLQVDIRQGLPFKAAAFQAVIANLSLHYFRWEQTRAVFAGVRARLKPGGYLLVRLNSSGDVFHGAASEQIVEDNCRIYSGVLKRYFDRDDLEQLFGDSWRVLGMEEQVIYCYRQPKAVWEVVVQKI